MGDGTSSTVLLLSNWCNSSSLSWISSRPWFWKIRAGDQPNLLCKEKLLSSYSFKGSTRPILKSLSFVECLRPLNVFAKYLSATQLPKKTIFTLITFCNNLIQPSLCLQILFIHSTLHVLVGCRSYCFGYCS